MIKNGRRKFRPFVPKEGRGYKRAHGEQADFSSFQFSSLQFSFEFSFRSLPFSSPVSTAALHPEAPHHRATHLDQQDTSSRNEDRLPDRVFTDSNPGQYPHEPDHAPLTHVRIFNLSTIANKVYFTSHIVFWFLALVRILSVITPPN